MTKSFLWLGSILLALQITGCRQHECPTPVETHIPTVKQIELKDDQISDASCNSLYPDFNRGADARIHTTAWTFSGSYGRARTFLNFDLSSIPANSTIIKAELTLYADTTNNYNASRGHSTYSGSNSWKIKRIISDWRENTITWNTRPNYDDVGAISMPESTSGDETYVVDITTFISDQYKNPFLYYGIM